MAARWMVAATLVWLSGAVAAHAVEPTPAAYDKDVKPLLKKYCADCHSGGDANAGVDLDKFPTASSIESQKEVWSRILRNTHQELMPPQDAEQPTPEERKRIVGWIQGYVFHVDCGGPPRPGRVTMRRLNRAEYNNTIRDLLGVDFKPAEDFPADEVGYGFDNIGDVLAMPPILLEKYLAAAEKIVKAAVMTAEDKKPPVVIVKAERLGPGGGPANGARLLGSHGEVGFDHTFEKRGEYTIRVQAWGDQAGKEPCKMELKLDGKVVRTVDVEATDNNPQGFPLRVDVKKDGEKHRIAAAFINDFYEPENPNPRQRDRNLYVASFDVAGPAGYRPALKDSHKRIFTRSPTSKADERKCARELLENFARKAYRRPVQADEVERLVKVYDFGRAEGEDFEGGVALGVQAALCSPNFIFRVENDPKSLAPDAVYTINEHELAVRLSYFLWSTMPDDQLFKLAEKNELRKNLEPQVKRMLADPKSQALVDNFARQWLTLRTLDNFNPDKRRFGEWNDELRNAMRQETELFFAHVMREDRPILEFIDCDYTFLNERLAKHYGVPNVSGNEFKLVKLDDKTPRGGLITQASILAVTSNPTRTSPVKRGKWVLEQLLGTPPPPPPPGVPELEEGKKGKLHGSLRQRMEQHRADPGCASCHARMDPIGFGLENFNAVGQWRDKDGDFAVDATGELPGGDKFAGPAELKRILLRKADFFRRNLVDKLLTYATGRGVEYYDQCSVDGIAEQTEKNGDKFSQLVLAIVKSAPFQQRRGPAGEK